jgi:hypothetical protein
MDREEVLTKASLMRVGEVVSRSQFSLRLVEVTCPPTCSHSPPPSTPMELLLP